MERNKKIVHLPVEEIQPGPYQLRQEIEEVGLQELAASIEEKGVIQPIIVRSLGNNKYEIIVGERRLRACKLRGVTEIPAVVENVTPEESLTLALIENIQRKDLTPIEEASAFKILSDKYYNGNHNEVARKLGLKPNYVSDRIRLLNLPITIQTMVHRAQLPLNHALTLLDINKPEEQIEWAKKTVEKHLTLAQLESRIQHIRPVRLSPSSLKPEKVVVKAKRASLELFDGLSKLGVLFGNNNTAPPIKSDKTLIGTLEKVASKLAEALENLRPQSAVEKTIAGIDQLSKALIALAEQYEKEPDEITENESLVEKLIEIADRLAETLTKIS